MIGDVLKRLRKIYGYTGAEIGSHLGISVSYLSEIENGRKSPSLALLEKYSDVFDIKLSSLILLSENYAAAEKDKKGNAFIRNMMISLINGLSQNIGETDEATHQKV